MKRSSTCSAIYLVGFLALSWIRVLAAPEEIPCESKYGVMFHFLGDHGKPDSEWSKRVEAFDVAALAAQLEEIRADHFIITLGQNSGHFCAPNATYNRITGNEPGTKTSTRDLVADLHEELHPRGIRLMVYIPTSAPLRDDAAEKAFGFDPETWDGPIRMDAARKWAEVLEEWSLRYRNMVDGWWVDGAYRSRFSDEDEMRRILLLYKQAMTSGNPDAKVCFNYAFSHTKVIRFLELDDFTAGEMHRIGDLPPADWQSPPRWHALPFIGRTWGDPEARYETNLLCSWTRDVIDRGGEITFDAGPNLDPDMGPIGTLSQGHMAQLRAIRDVVRNGADIEMPAASAAELKLRVRYGPDGVDAGGLGPATMTGDAELVDGGPTGGRAIRLDGRGDSLQLGDPERLRLVGPISLSAWVRPSSLRGQQNIIAKGFHDSPGSRGEIALRIQDGHYQIAVWDGGDDGVAAPAPDADIGEWVHLAAVYDGMRWIFYRNGSELATSYSARGAVPVAAGWAVGSRGGGAGERCFKGDIGEVRIYSGCLDPQQVADLAAMRVSRPSSF